VRRLLILADDLSGAADCGVACANAGLNTIVGLRDISGSSTEEALSIDADTRRLDAGTAAARMEHLVHTYAAEPEILLFRKIDSTLRGHLGLELSAVLRARRASVRHAIAVMAPAFPAFGRTTVNGLQHLYGLPLHRTEVWRHQQMSGKAHIPAMLQAAGLTTAQVSLTAVRSSSIKLHRAFTAARETAAVLICDAETDADLVSIAEATAALGPEAIWVGSAGLAHCLPSAAGLAHPGREDLAPQLPIAGPILFVIGSMSRISRQQVAMLATSSGVRVITIPPEILLSGPESSAWHTLESEALHAIQQGQDVILAPGSEPEVEISRRPLLSYALSRICASLPNRIGALVASGGETARMVLDAWDIRALRLLGELETGVPVSVVASEGICQGLTVVTKAGEFGTTETLLHCRELLHNRRGVFL